jgi:two-component system nitrate/nitrite response regulator NarL
MLGVLPRKYMMSQVSDCHIARISVLIADADLMGAQLIAGGLSRGKTDIEIVAVSSNSSEALQELKKHQPDIALINARLNDGPLTGYMVLQNLQNACPKTAAIMMIPISERDLVIDAFRGGARGVFCRAQSIRELAKCIRRVRDGQIWANNHNLQYILEFLTTHKPLRVVKPGGGMLQLTNREAQLVSLLAEGMGTREISQKLEITEHTVRNYLSNIYDKLGVSSRVELALYAVTREDMSHSTGN